MSDSGARALERATSSATPQQIRSRVSRTGRVTVCRAEPSQPSSPWLASYSSLAGSTNGPRRRPVDQHREHTVPRASMCIPIARTDYGPLVSSFSWPLVASRRPSGAADSTTAVARKGHAGSNPRHASHVTWTRPQRSRESTTMVMRWCSVGAQLEPCRPCCGGGESTERTRGPRRGCPVPTKHRAARTP